MKIPMVDLKIQYESIREEIDGNIRSVLDSGRFILGPLGQALEERAADYLGVRHAINVASGTDALHLALRAAGVSEGDEVITTPFTFIATAEAIRYVGATPVFVDIDPDTFNLDPDAVEAAVTSRTKAVLPVHLFGQPADMDRIMETCRRHDLLCVEDCAQSFGAGLGGRKTGAFGDAGCFSFFPSKNLGAYGDGGMIVTSDDRIAEEIRTLRNHGSRKQYIHSIIGYNSRLDEFQAAILLPKLKRIDDYNSMRRENAARYSARLAGSGIVPPLEAPSGAHVYHQYTVRTTQRARLMEALAAEGIASAVYYPVPLHRQEVFEEACRDVNLPQAEKAAEEVMSLPIFPELTAEQVDLVCDTLLSA